MSAVPTQPGLRILVCGGRDYTDQTVVFGTLDRLRAERGIACIIAGAAAGADRMAADWAHDRRVNLIKYPVSPAAWRQHGKAAGPMRNATMLREGKPDAVVAFPGGRGTADMIRQADAAGVTVWRPAGER